MSDLIIKATCGGFCERCGRHHHLPFGPAREAAYALMKELRDKKKIGPISTAYLYGPARGKMFGVLVCRDRRGTTHILKAFSGQNNGIWELDGWAPPLFKVDEFNRLNTPAEEEIKKLGRIMEKLSPDTAIHSRLKKIRKKKSQILMKRIHNLYHIHNFRNEQRSLSDLFLNKQGIPTGAGDCCAPKLLNQAAISNFEPLGLAEFFWGRENRSGTKQEGHFYPACTNKCGPILGFMLCGIENI